MGPALATQFPDRPDPPLERLLEKPNLANNIEHPQIQQITYQIKKFNLLSNATAKPANKTDRIVKPMGDCCVAPGENAAKNKETPIKIGLNRPRRTLADDLERGLH
jgi:hypothetical protein